MPHSENFVADFLLCFFCCFPFAFCDYVDREFFLPGYYCDSPELADVSGPCAAGYYCRGQSSKVNPIGEDFGDVCPAGHYCPLNSSTPTPCPRGLFVKS